MSPALAGGYLTTAPPGKSPSLPLAIIRAHLSTVPRSGCYPDNLQSAQRWDQDGEGPGHLTGTAARDSGTRDPLGSPQAALPLGICPELVLTSQGNWSPRRTRFLPRRQVSGLVSAPCSHREMPEAGSLACAGRGPGPIGSSALSPRKTLSSEAREAEMGGWLGCWPFLSPCLPLTFT